MDRTGETDLSEWGTQDYEAKSADYIAKGYIPISMKNDFAVIYPEGITKANEQYVPIVLPEDELDNAA